MFKLSPVCFHVNRICRHCQTGGVINLWLIHVVPGRVKVGRAFEIFVWILVGPEVLSIFVQKVDPSRISWPTVPIEGTWASCKAFSHKDVWHILGWLFLELQLHALIVDPIVVSNLDMRIDDHGQTSVRWFNFIVQFRETVRGEVCRVELKVAHIIADPILLGPLNVGPEHVHWESEARKVDISLSETVCGHVIPLAEVESECLNHRQRHKAGNSRQIMVHILHFVWNFLRVLRDSTRKNEKLKGSSFWSKCCKSALLIFKRIVV